MARKSRRSIAEEGFSRKTDGGESPKQNAFQAALYVRLSVEDKRKQESHSVENQETYLRAWTARQELLTVAGVYIDRGESGANFHRTAFVQMLEDIREGKINCVVVKDLSRFGRNHIEAGRYIEEIFPILGVRFIAINDGIDSFRESGGENALTMPLKNLINEFYARDISAKVVSNFRVKQEKGEFLGAFAPYGYLRSPESPHRLVPDPEAAEVVRRIFTWSTQGLGAQAIAGILNRTGIPSPQRHRKHLEGRGDPSIWHKSTIQRILNNPVYLGHMVQGKEKTSTFFGNRRVRIPGNQWIVVENTHVPLI